jgi:hypothetical protein
LRKKLQENGRNSMYSCNNVNGKMRPVETIPGTGGGGDKGE